MDRNSNKIKSFEGSKIISFENFETKQFEGVTNRYMIDILEGLTSKGIHIGDMEQPEWGTDGMIEISETATISFSTGKHKKMWCTLALPDGTFATSKGTDSLDEALQAWDSLKKKHNVLDADYTNESVAPVTPTVFLKEERAARVDKAAKLIESAIQELKRAPKIDSMNDIPELIEKLSNILKDENDYGLENLAKLYNEKH